MLKLWYVSHRSLQDSAPGCAFAVCICNRVNIMVLLSRYSCLYVQIFISASGVISGSCNKPIPLHLINKVSVFLYKPVTGAIIA